MSLRERLNQIVAEVEAERDEDERQYKECQHAENLRVFSADLKWLLGVDVPAIPVDEALEYKMEGLIFTQNGVGAEWPCGHRAWTRCDIGSYRRGAEINNPHEAVARRNAMITLAYAVVILEDDLAKPCPECENVEATPKPPQPRPMTTEEKFERLIVQMVMSHIAEEAWIP